MQTEEFYDPSQKRDKNGRWTRTSGGEWKRADTERRSHFPNGANPDAAAVVAIDALRSDVANLTADQRKRYNEHVPAVANFIREAIGDSPDVRSRVSLYVLEHIVEDGRMKTQHDSGMSQGMFAPDRRDLHEKAMFESDQTRPIYGYVTSPVTRKHVLNPYLDIYGDVAIVMKPEVVDRTTMTVGDSLFEGAKIAPIPVRDVMTASDDRLMVAVTENHPKYFSLRSRAFDEAEPALDLSSSKSLYGPGYFEAQIHGKVTLADIDRVVVTDQRAFEKATRILEGTGIGVELFNGDDPDNNDFGTVEQSDFFHSPTVHVLGSISLNIEEFYDPSQRRDRTGKWTSGGGGVSGPSAPRKKEAAAGGKVSGDSTHNPTEFGAKIKRMIEDDPVLAGRPRLSDVDDWIAADKASANVAAEEKLGQTLRDPYRWSISVRPASDYSTESRGAASNMTIKLRDSLTDSLTDGTKKFMDDPDATPSNEFESLIQKEIKARLADPLAEWNSGQSTNVTVDVGGQPVSIVMTVRTPSVIARRPDVSKMVEDTVDDQFLDSALRVGHVIREEIGVRTAARVETTLAAREVLRERVRELGVDPDSIAIYGTSSGNVVRGKAADGTPLSKEIEDSVSKLLNETDKRLVGTLQGNIEVATKAAAVNARQEAYREVMSEIMPMGGVVAGTPRHKAGRSGLSSNEQAVAGASRYPSSWVDLSGRTGDVNFKKTSNRAHYMHDTNGTGTITLNGRVSTAVHELGHRFERTVPGLYALERRFHARRTDGESSVPLQGIFPGHRYGRDERTFEDDFYHAYAGKVYDNTRAFEVFTVGMEGTSMGTGGNGRKGPRTIDTDHEAFILGALTTLVRP